MKRRNGFTLIELSIVLIIIGIIIGGVMKGRDLINSADQKKIYNTWLRQWAVTINEYQDRTGRILADGNTNGGTATENGIMDNVNIGTTITVQNALKAVGLEAPSVGLNNGGSYALKGKYYSRTVNMQLLNGGTRTNNHNAIYIGMMPTDIAIAFDKMVDGVIDPLNGDFQNYSDRATTTWPDASTANYVNVYLVVD